jgi:hypothetical protein
MQSKHRAVVALLVVGSAFALAVAARAATLEGRAILPAATFAPGPVSGTAIGGPAINPFSTGRNPALPDYDDFIVVRTGSLKNG